MLLGGAQRASAIRQKRLDLIGLEAMLISFNGGRITNFATGEVIYDITLPDGMIHELYDYSKKEHTGILTYDAGKIVAHSDTDPYITIDAKGCDIPIWVPEDFHRECEVCG